jgi:hypothetical protein
MRGRILLYKEDSGEGIALGEDKKKYKLSVMDWEDIENMPSIGIFIEFTAEGDEAKCISVFKEEEKVEESPAKQPKNDQSANSNQNESSEYADRCDLPQDNDIDQNSHNFKTIKVPNKKSSKNSPEENEDEYEDEVIEYDEIPKPKKKKLDIENLSYIPLNPTYKEFIQDYFSIAIDTVSNIEIKQDSKLLSYIHMRRFLVTAFDHLIDKDPTFIDDTLKDIKLLLERTFRVYKAFQETKSYPDIKFDSIFVKKQKVYNEINQRFDENKNKLLRSKQRAEDLNRKLTYAENTLNKLSLKSAKYQEINIKAKKIRTVYADVLDDISLLTNQNTLFTNLKNDFEAKYKNDFISFFNDESEKINNQLLLILNSYAYLFDTYMWELAKKSSGIKQFFIEANIDGSFSSKTFLKYFLKNLDNEKMNDEYIEMQELLEYLETLEKGSILIVDDRSEMLPSLKYFANHIDKIYKVKLLNPREVINELYSSDVQYIIVNIHIKGLKLFDLIKKVKHVRESIEFVLTSDQFTKDLLVKAKSIGVKNFVATNVNDEVLVKTLEKIVAKVEDED